MVSKVTNSTPQTRNNQPGKPSASVQKSKDDFPLQTQTMPKRVILLHRTKDRLAITK